MAKQHNKITPQIYKEIESIAQNLPGFQRKNADGSLMYRNVGRRLSGYDIPKEAREQIKNFDVKNFYSQQGQEPIMVNHSVNLRKVWFAEGRSGIEAYCNFFKAEHEKQTVQTKELTKNENIINSSK